MTATLKTYVDHFLMAKKTEGRSDATLRHYRFMLTRFVDFLGQGLSEPPTLKDLNVEHGRAFVADLQGRTSRFEDHPTRAKQAGGLSAHSVYACVRTIKVFSRWLYEEGFTPTDTLARVKRPKLPETEVTVLTDEEIGRIFADLKPTSFKGARNLAIYLLLLDTGIRATELVTLTLDNVDLEKGEIKVRGKGNKERTVPLVDNTRKVLMAYLHFWRPEVITDRVFVTYDGEPMTYNALAHVTHRLGARVGISRLHPHLFRHTFAVKWLVNGGDVITLRNSLGHTNLEMTTHYLQLSDTQRQAKHDQFSPVSKLNLKSLRPTPTRAKAHAAT